MPTKKTKKPAKKATVKKTAVKATAKTKAVKAKAKPAKAKATKAKVTKKVVKKVAKTTKAATPVKATKPAKVVRKNAAMKVSEPMKKAQLFNHISECNGVARKEIADIFQSLSEIMESHLKKGGPGEFTVPGLMKCKVIRKPATKARKGINPFTGEPTTFKAKPARNVIKVRPLKALKEMAN